MSKRKRRIGVIQNLAILCLSLSALVLLVRTFSYESGTDGLLPSLNTLLVTGGQTGGTGETTDLSGMASPFNLVATTDHGRYGRMLAVSADSDIVHASNLLREAVGSATGAVSVQETQFRSALEQTSLFFDYMTPLPVSVFGDWYGGDFSEEEFDVRYVVVSAPEGGTASLYLWDGQGAVHRYNTAVEYAALVEATVVFRSEDVAASGEVVFAFEDPENYGHLCPYTVLGDETTETNIYNAAIPTLAGDVEQLLSLLDFNPHTANSYTQTSTGTEVVVEYPSTLWVQTDGVILYQGDVSATSDLFHVGGVEEEPTAAEAVLAVRRLADRLLGEEILGDNTIYLSGIQETEEGYLITFDYLVDGMPVYFSDGTSALSAEIVGTTITNFRLRYRQYTSSGDTYQLLPLDQAIHMATVYEGALLTRGYVDRGRETIVADWLAR